MFSGATNELKPARNKRNAELKLKNFIVPRKNFFKTKNCGVILQNTIFCPA